MMRPFANKLKSVSLLVFLLNATLAFGAPQKTGWRSADAGSRDTLMNQEAFLRFLIHSDRLDDLRWPNFSDYRADVQKFYSRAYYQPAWLRGGQPAPQAVQMIGILQHADSVGLRPEDYDSLLWPERLAGLQQPHSFSDEVRFDVALTICTMRYVSALRGGRIRPRFAKFRLPDGARPLDLAKFVQERLAGGDDLPSELAAVEPPFAGYRELKKALATYMRLAREDDPEPLPLPKDLGYPGPPYAGFADLARLLLQFGDLPADYSVAEGNSRVYDATLLQAVRRFQERHGLPASGYLDTQTIEQLNIPLSYRVQQIQLALERYRWVRDDLPRPLIVVNIPGFHLYAFDREGKVALSMKVDVGDDFNGTRTPVMEDLIEYLVFRPYWAVPLDIQKNEIVPALAHDPAYLRNFHFDVIAPGGQAVTSGQLTASTFQKLRAGQFRLRQRPGPENAMGLVKFVFPNRYNVYLHDIPARDLLFSLPRRVVSHGCVHVEKPAQLAAWMLRDKPQWTLSRVRQAMNSGRDNRRVELSRPLAVLFLYTTATAHEDGEVDFYQDVYGYDASLLQALARGYPYPR